MSGEYPDLRDVQSYLENLLERNEDRRHRYLTWLGSSITALAVLAWVTLDRAENAPAIQNVEAGLILLTLLLIIHSFADSLLPEGFLGLFRTVTSPWESGRSQTQLTSFILANLPIVRERVVISQIGAMLTNVPLLIVFWRSAPTNIGAASIALGVAAIRVALSMGATALFLAIAHEDKLKLYLESVKHAEATLTRSQRLLLFAYKLARVERALGALVKVAFYGVFVVALSWLLVQYSGPSWTELRLVLLASAIGILIRFGAHTWTQIKWLGEENEAWGAIRVKILFGDLKTQGDVFDALKKEAEDVLRRRHFPFKLPDE